MAESTPAACRQDERKGICEIKSEFVVGGGERGKRREEDSSREDESAEDPREEDGDESPVEKKSKLAAKREDKPRGRNKTRPPPFKAPRRLSLCPWIVDQAENEPEKLCRNARCDFMHDRAAYMKIKAPDIGAECYVFNLSGRCPRGVSCRTGSAHLTKDGYNVVEEEKYAEYRRKPASVKNQLDKRLQDRLRKREYVFFRADDETAEKKARIANGDSSDGKNGTTACADSAEKVPGVQRSEAGESRIGPASDYDVVAPRISEKKKIQWRDKILLSPLTTVGNLPFRRICKEFGADVTCGEMALAPKILQGASREYALIKRHETEDIFGVQICGNNTGVLARCAQLLNREADIDYIDLNLGCPIDLIYRQGGGSGMLNRTNILESVVRSINRTIDVPLTIKTRTGVYMDKPIAHNLVGKFRDWGVSMITVHGRSREQRYTKSADWEYIEKCARAADPMPVFGNGDILSYEDYARVRETHRSVQGVTIGRGALIKPWIFAELKEAKLLDVRSGQRFDMLKKYANYGLEHWGSDTRGVETTRRFMLEWISFLHRYIPVGILEKPPQRINERPPYYRGRDEMETMMASANCADWIKISEMLLGKVPDGFHFLPKHKANSWK